MKPPLMPPSYFPFWFITLTLLHRATLKARIHLSACKMTRTISHATWKDRESATRNLTPMQSRWNCNSAETSIPQNLSEGRIGLNQSSTALPPISSIILSGAILRTSTTIKKKSRSYPRPRISLLLGVNFEKRISPRRHQVPGAGGGVSATWYPGNQSTSEPDITSPRTC